MEHSNDFTTFTGFTASTHPSGSETIHSAARPTRLFYTPQQFYEHYGGEIGKASIYRMIRTGVIKHVKPGTRNILIPASELSAWQQRAMHQTN